MIESFSHHFAHQMPPSQLFPHLSVDPSGLKLYGHCFTDFLFTYSPPFSFLHCIKDNQVSSREENWKIEGKICHTQNV